MAPLQKRNTSGQLEVFASEICCWESRRSSHRLGFFRLEWTIGYTLGFVERIPDAASGASLAVRCDILSKYSLNVAVGFSVEKSISCQTKEVKGS